MLHKLIRAHCPAPNFSQLQNTQGSNQSCRLHSRLPRCTRRAARWASGSAPPQVVKGRGRREVRDYKQLNLEGPRSFGAMPSASPLFTALCIRSPIASFLRFRSLRTKHEKYQRFVSSYSKCFVPDGFSARFSAATLFEQRAHNSEVFLSASYVSLHSTTFFQGQQKPLFQPAQRGVSLLPFCRLLSVSRFYLPTFAYVVLRGIAWDGNSQTGVTRSLYNAAAP